MDKDLYYILRGDGLKYSDTKAIRCSGIREENRGIFQSYTPPDFIMQMIERGDGLPYLFEGSQEELKDYMKKHRGSNVPDQPTIPYMPKTKNPNPNYRPPIGGSNVQCPENSIIALPVGVSIQRAVDGWEIEFKKAKLKVFLPDLK